jgi:hypothetical protein
MSAGMVGRTPNRVNRTADCRGPGRPGRRRGPPSRGLLLTPGAAGSPGAAAEGL